VNLWRYNFINEPNGYPMSANLSNSCC